MTAQEQKAIYTPTPKQGVFHSSAADNKLYGWAKGGWKSRALRMEAVIACQSAPDVHGIIFRRTYPQLLKSIIRKLLWELPKGTYKYNKSEHIMTFDNGSTLEFWHCQYDDDVINYQGAEYDFMMFDELTQFTEYQFTYLSWSVRNTKNYFKTFIAASANPGGVGHHFVKRLFVDWLLDEEEQAQTWEFIPATVFDNPHIIDNDPGYIRKLNNLPEDERKALRDGDWEAFAGQYFNEFSKTLNVIEPFKIPWNWRKIICLDYWYSAPSAIYWIAQDPDKNYYVYREIYITKKLYGELLDLIESYNLENVTDLVADPALRTKSQDTGVSFFDIAFSKGFNIIPGVNDRIPGWQLIKKLLQKKEDPRDPRQTRLYFFSNCEAAIRTVPALPRDKKKVEDIDTHAEDHAADAIRYWLVHFEGLPRSFSEIAEINQKARIREGRILNTTF